MGLVSETIYYKEIYIRYAEQLIRFSEKFVPAYCAEDIVQDVFLKLWDRQIFNLPEDEIRRVLYVSVRHACIDHLRKTNLEQEIFDRRDIDLKIEELHYFESSEDLFMRKDLLALLLKQVEELPERSREIFKMSYLEGLKTAEIAERLDISIRTVENHLYRSLLSIRKKSDRLFLFLFTLI